MKINKYIEEVNCNLCGRNDNSVLIKPVRKSVGPNDIFSASRGIRGTQRIVQCRNCRLIYVSPRFKSFKIIKAYQNSLDHGYSSQERGRRQTFVKGVSLVNKLYQKRGRLLDVGCANGVFLQIAKRDGWQAFGVEPSKQLVSQARSKGLKVYQGTLDKQKFKPSYFDVVTYWDVLEHIADPSLELKLVSQLLKANGLILINFPDVDSLLAKLSGPAWWFYLSVHLYYFSYDTLTKLLRKTGFKPIYFKRHIQYLELGYLASLISLYNKTLSRLVVFLFDKLGLSRVLIPYYASQKTLVAKKIS